MTELSQAKQAAADETRQIIGWLTSDNITPTGLWIDTACQAKGTGVPYRSAVLSPDGFWTIDVRLESFAIGDLVKPAGDRYIRLIIRSSAWGGGRAHDIADKHHITPKDKLAFSGALILNQVRPASLELHLVDDLQIITGHNRSAQTPSQ